MTSGELTYTLLSDGSSDRALMPIIEWTINQLQPELLVQGVRADLSQLKQPPKNLLDRVDKALMYYPCDVLFIHRDGEKETYESRSQEIEANTELIARKYESLRTVAIIPVRMTEAWLLIDSKAIKTAAGNPNGPYNPVLPAVKTIESLPNPKETLYSHLRQASGLKGRQLDKFNVGRAVYLVAENIATFSLLRNLPAYQHFVMELQNVLPMSR